MAETRTTTDGVRAPVSSGLVASARALADGLLAAAHERLELFALELREEKLRAVQLIVWLSLAVFAGGLAVVFASITLVYLFWDSGRLAVLVGLTLLYAIAGGFAVWSCRRCLRRFPRPFEATLAELKKDRACIPRRN